MLDSAFQIKFSFPNFETGVKHKITFVRVVKTKFGQEIRIELENELLEEEDSDSSRKNCPIFSNKRDLRSLSTFYEF